MEEDRTTRLNVLTNHLIVKGAHTAHNSNTFSITIIIIYVNRELDFRYRPVFSMNYDVIKLQVIMKMATKSKIRTT